MLADQQEEFEFEFQCIIPENEEDHYPLQQVECYAGLVAPKLTSAVLRVLEQIGASDETLSHLKRVCSPLPGEKRLRVLICRRDWGGWEDIKESQSFKEMVEEYQIELQLVSVPKTAPLTSHQYHLWRELWPLRCCPPSIVRPDSSWTKEDRIRISSCLLLAKKEAQKALQKGQREIGAVICNSKGEVLCKGHDNSMNHPLQHAVMQCIHKVSKLISAETDQYLASNYQLFTNTEPCIMCSMAILHSRFALVVYCDADEKNGGLGSVCKIHVASALNHHFDVYQAIPSKPLT